MIPEGVDRLGQPVIVGHRHEIAVLVLEIVEIEPHHVEHWYRRRRCETEDGKLIADLRDVRTRPLPVRCGLPVTQIDSREIAFRIGFPVMIFAQAGALDKRVGRPVAKRLFSTSFPGRLDDPL